MPFVFEKKIHALSKCPLNHSVLFFFVLICLTGCTKKIYDVVYPTLSDGKYDTEFPYKNCSRQLEEISRSVKKLNCIVYYNSYIFSEEDQITKSDLNSRTIRNKAIKNVVFNKSGSGTATIIYHDADRIALLTCAHIIDTPDTIMSYFRGAERGGEEIIQSVSIKVRQQNFIVDIPIYGGEVEIIKIDRKKDIAVVGRKGLVLGGFVPVFSYPAGKSSELEWGSFVYLIGYPVGFKMITRGIVSNPNMDASGRFLIDALFNRGFSGGVVLAIKDGVPNFELVGIAKSVSVKHVYVLRPSEDVGEYSYDPNVPYRGDTYVQLKSDINYGITHAISIETIWTFFDENKKFFIEKGYDFKGLFD